MGVLRGAGGLDAGRRDRSGLFWLAQSWVHDRLCGVDNPRSMAAGARQSIFENDPEVEQFERGDLELP